MNLQILINIVVFCIFVFLTTTSSGANVKNGLSDTKSRIPEGLTVENLQLPANDRRINVTTPQPKPVTSATNSETPLYRLPGSNGAACILIRTDAMLEFNFVDTLGQKDKGDTYIPDNYEPTGNCESTDNAYVTISWLTYRWTVYFSKTPGGEHWYVSQMKLIADSKEKPFKNVKNPPKTFKFSTPTEQTKMLFPTPVGKAFTCSEEQKVEMRDGDVVATVFLRDLKMQPFIFKKDDFGPEYICTPGGAKSYRDETAPIAVGSTLAIVTLLTVTGYGIYRYMKIKKVQYDTME